MQNIEISCVEVWQLVSDYIDGDLHPELRERIEAHLRVCKHCTAIMDGANNVVRLVADGRSFDLPAGFSERLYSKLKSSSG